MSTVRRHCGCLVGEGRVATVVYEHCKEHDPARQPESGELENRLREILEQTVQVTRLGSFPEKVPQHNHWINVMGDVYELSFDISVAWIIKAFKDAGWMSPPALTEDEAMDELEGRV